MSIMRNIEVMPNKMRAIYNWILSCNGYEENEKILQRWIIPQPYDITLSGDSRRKQFIKKNLVELKELGIIVEEDDKIKLTNEIIEIHKTKLIDFPLLISNLLFTRGSQRNEEFLYTLAWIMSIDSLSAPSSWDEFQTKINMLGLREKTGITNSNPYGNFKIWTKFLGFSWEYERFVPDPTEQVRWRLKTDFNEKNEWPIAEFMSRLSQVVPVMDGGYYYKEIVSMLNVIQGSQLSTSLSLALKRLEDEKLIRLLAKSDADSRKLANQFGGSKLSHIIIN